MGKDIFAVNMPLKLFRATVANADMESLKFLHTLFGTYLDNMLPKFEPHRMIQNVQNFELFTKTDSFLNHFCQSAAAILQDVSAAETIV